MSESLLGSAQGCGVMTGLFLVVSLGAAAVPSGTHELGRGPAKEPRAISPSFPRASFQALWLRPSLLYHRILGFLNRCHPGHLSSCPKSVLHGWHSLQGQLS